MSTDQDTTDTSTGAESLLDDATRGRDKSAVNLSADLAQKFDQAKNAAINGDRDAIHYVIQAYQTGLGCEPNYSKAFEWLRVAAEVKRDSEFFFDLACCYRDGDGTSKDVDKYWSWMRKAAEAGQTEAMFQLATSHLNPDLGQLSPERAFEWTKRMADKNEPAGLIQLARMYDDGEVVERDAAKFLAYAEKAVAAALEKQKQARDSDGDWTLEDHPEALATLSDAYERSGDSAESKKLGLEAAEAAWSAFERAKQEDKSGGHLLSQVMLRALPRQLCDETDTTSEQRDDKIKWLRRIHQSIQYIYLLKGIDVPVALIDVIFELASILKPKEGSDQDDSEYRELLTVALDLGHGRAAYIHAIECYRLSELLDFNQFLSIAANANDSDALIAQQLAAINLCKDDFFKALDAMLELRKTVTAIRESKHQIGEQDATAGIAHYTDSDALCSMLIGPFRSNRNAVRLSNTAYVNDPTEGKRLREFQEKDFTNPLESLYRELGDRDTIDWNGKELHIFIACFSRQADSLNLWRFYGRDGGGFSIVSPRSAFGADTTEGVIRGLWGRRTVASSKLSLYSVLYQTDEVKDTLIVLAKDLLPIQTLADSLDSETGRKLRSVAVAVISDLLYLYKDNQYSDEKELRAVEARALGDTDIKEFRPEGKPYSRLYLETDAMLFREPGSEIIIGPKVPDAAAMKIDLQHKLACQNWAATCTVRESQHKHKYR